MLHAFSRTELLLGSDAIKTLAQKKIAIFGIGGVGTFVVEGLVRSGIGNLILVDDDNICLTNINRQIHASFKTIGKPKVDVMKERILDINPNANVAAYKLFYNDKVEDSKFANCDFLVDAIDTVSSKIALIEMAKRINVPIISCMGAGNKLDPTKFEVTDIYKTKICPLAKVMRKELRKRGIESLKVVYSLEEPKSIVENNDSLSNCDCLKESAKRSIPGSISFVPSVAGMIIAGEVIKDILKK